MALLIIFAFSLPFGDFDLEISDVLLATNAVLIILINGLYQDGEREPPYNKIGRVLLYTGIGLMTIAAAVSLILSVYDLTAVTAEINNSSQLAGWRYQQWPDVIIKLLVLAYTTGYLTAVFKQGQPWLPLIRPVNRVLAVSFAVVFWILYSPLGFWLLAYI
jgi:hypothetical protein